MAQWRSWNQAGSPENSLASGLQGVIDRAEQVLKATANYSAEGFAQARANLEDSLSMAKSRLADAQTRMSEKAHHAADSTQRYVGENPWKSIALVVAAGVIVGLLLGQGSHSSRETEYEE